MFLRTPQRLEYDMSTILFDQLLPYLGPDAAAYWANLLAVKPV